ncbi:MAG TPA: hypothetical protein VGK48_26970 [Terriglobia bacterium]|jgi:hypothetical protein
MTDSEKLAAAIIKMLDRQAWLAELRERQKHERKIRREKANVSQPAENRQVPA